MLSEFKQFIMRGNVVDLAVGVVIGAAFGKIVTSLVDDIIMPPVGVLLGKVDFSNMFVPLSFSAGHFNTIAEAHAAGVATWNIGLFCNTVFQFLLIALTIFFFIIKPINKLKRGDQENAAAAASRSEVLLEEIRDLLRDKKQ